MNGGSLKNPGLILVELFVFLYVLKEYMFIKLFGLVLNKSFKDDIACEMFCINKIHRTLVLHYVTVFGKNI